MKNDIDEKDFLMFVSAVVMNCILDKRDVNNK